MSKLWKILSSTLLGMKRQLIPLKDPAFLIGDVDLVSLLWHALECAVLVSENQIIPEYFSVFELCTRKYMGRLLLAPDIWLFSPDSVPLRLLLFLSSYRYATRRLCSTVP